MTSSNLKDTSHKKILSLDGLYENWFLDYASYVILERAIPRIEDGLKPVQRRIAHAIKEMDDGRFNKVANIIGQTMQYHPHGDAAIGDAIVNLGQKGLLLETQGNWGDMQTGDRAAAPRYIEARISKFALEVVYNTKTTKWQLSYDGRKKEPITLPVKFPFLLTQGVDGIAVGLSTKILPHNFRELILAAINILKGKTPEIYPDFPTGGYADLLEYRQGMRGGKVKVRAKIDIDIKDKKILIIKEIPYSTTTNSVIESIVKASEKGKIKLKKIIDNTSKNVEILILLQTGQVPETAIDALYAFTDCEISLSPNACVIVNNKPCFMSVDNILKYNVEQTTYLLKKELEIEQDELMEHIFFSSLEKIFIEKKIYRDIEQCDTFLKVINTIDEGLQPYKKQFYRKIEEEDIIKLTEIKIKRISKYDLLKAKEWLKNQEIKLAQTHHNLKHIIHYTITYYQDLLKKYGKNYQRKTIIKNFQSVMAHEVIANNQKLYVNKNDGFMGWSLKKDEYLCDCSEIDNIIAICKNGNMKISRITEKTFMGKNILYAGIWIKGNERMVYNSVYVDGKTGKSFVKRFRVSAVVRDREYNLTQESMGSKITYLSANPNGEAEVIQIKLSSISTARKKTFEFDFSTIDIKGRNSKGNILTPYSIRKITLLQKGISTLENLDIWFDPLTGRLNKDKKGSYIGKLGSNDVLLSITQKGLYKLSPFAFDIRFESDYKTILIEKFDQKKIITAVYYESKSKHHFAKRFKIETQTLNRDFEFIPPLRKSKVDYVSTQPTPLVEIIILKNQKKQSKKIDLSKKIDVKGWKALGNHISPYKVIDIKYVEKSSSQKTTSSDILTKSHCEKTIKPKEQYAKKKNRNTFQTGDVIELDF